VNVIVNPVACLPLKKVIGSRTTCHYKEKDLYRKPASQGRWRLSLTQIILPRFAGTGLCRAMWAGLSDSGHQGSYKF
jgi:hypothetical protein